MATSIEPTAHFKSHCFVGMRIPNYSVWSMKQKLSISFADRICSFITSLKVVVRVTSTATIALWEFNTALK